VVYHNAYFYLLHLFLMRSFGRASWVVGLVAAADRNDRQRSCAAKNYAKESLCVCLSH